MSREIVPPVRLDDPERVGEAGDFGSSVGPTWGGSRSRTISTANSTRSITHPLLADALRHRLATSSVGASRANVWGFHDTYGNVSGVLRRTLSRAIW